MNKKEGTKEMKYRLSILYIQSLYEQKIISEQNFKILKKKLIKKYKPLIGSLELDE